MHTEIEERVLEVNVEEITKRLEDLNALKVGEWNQKRYVYDFNPKRENEWIRLRDTGEQITLTYKNVEKNSIDGTKELEVEVSDFEETNQLLKILGYNPVCRVGGPALYLIVTNSFISGQPLSS